MDMVERVARAICERRVKHDLGMTTLVQGASRAWVTDRDRDLAEAAIEAMGGEVLAFAVVYEKKGLRGDAETIRAVAEEVMNTAPATPSSE